MSATRRIGVRRDAGPVTTYLRAFSTRGSGTRGERSRADATTGAVRRALRDITRRRT